MSRRRRARGRGVSGILLLDKPEGIGSNAALQRCKQLFDAAKAGHTGSLDMPASGLLPICLGEATKISGFLLEAAKRYRARFALGVSTATGDAQGEVIERRPVPELSPRDLDAALAAFTGEIMQRPPMHSAIKRGGVPLYKLAYEGKVIEREPRRVIIHELRRLDHGGDWLEVEIACSKGTYVRTLAEDVGGALGCGAHVAGLRRLAVGPFRLEDAWTMPALEALAAERGEAGLDATLLPADAGLGDWPAASLSADACFYLGRGQPVQVPRAPTAGLLRLYEPGGGFFGVGEVLDDGRIALKRRVRA